MDGGNVYIERDLEKVILDNLKNREIIAVTGPRQAGKTTMLRHISEGLKNAAFLNFEDRDVLELFMSDEKAFAELYVKNNRYLFIDEFQYAKDGGKKLKYIYDTYEGTKIIISGSSASGLTIHEIKYLVGRIFVFNLYPLSFEEFLRYKNRQLFSVYSEKKNAIRRYLSGDGNLPELSTSVIGMLNRVYGEYIVYGGYPRVAISKSDDDRKTVLKNIYSTYFLREIKDLFALTTDFNLAKLVKALSLQLGGLISYNSLAEVSGLDYKGVLTHMNILEKTFICKMVPPFFTNKRTELIKAPKIYFFDNGLRNSIIDDFKPANLRQDIGHLNENLIFSQLTYSGIDVKYWRSKSKAEVDFIININSNLFALESKTTPKCATKSLRSFREKYKPHKSVILCSDTIKQDSCVLYLPFVFVSSLSS